MIPHFRTFASFIFIGASAAFGYIILSYFLTQAGLKPWIASFTSYVIFIPIVYSAQRNLTFRSVTAHRTSLPRYVFAQTSASLLSALLPYLFSRAGIPVGLSFVAVALTATLVNFLLQNYWVFGNYGSASQEDH